MADSTKAECFILTAFAAGVLLIGGIMGFCINEACWRADSVKHGAAEYDSQSGAWRWKEPKPQEPKGEE